uniref:(northern house mosquito) hypothetical protein n=1 Tax=Culex pipiens TaxID=7175 RepID=A0A8D8I0B6_CULPI
MPLSLQASPSPGCVRGPSIEPPSSNLLPGMQMLQRMMLFIAPNLDVLPTCWLDARFTFPASGRVVTVRQWVGRLDTRTHCCCSLKLTGLNLSAPGQCLDVTSSFEVLKSLNWIFLYSFLV